MLFLATINKILSSSLQYHLFEEQKDYLFKNTPPPCMLDLIGGGGGQMVH